MDTPDYEKEYRNELETERKILVDLYSRIKVGRSTEEIIRKIDQRHREITELQEQERKRDDFEWNPKAEIWENHRAYKISKDGPAYTKGKGLQEGMSNIGIN